MKRSRLLSKEFSINDVLYLPRTPKQASDSTNEPKVEILVSTPQVLTPQKDLFKGLSFKRMGSLDVTDAEDSPGGSSYSSSPNIAIENPLQFEKIRLKMQKSEQSEKGHKRLDPNRHLWQQDGEERALKKVMTLRHISQIQNKNAKMNALKMSTVLYPVTQ